MDIPAIFGLQFLLSLLAWGVIARVLLSPRLAQLPQHEHGRQVSLHRRALEDHDPGIQGSSRIKHLESEH